MEIEWSALAEPFDRLEGQGRLSTGRHHGSRRAEKPATIAQIRVK
jgi:hypothetical protein